MKDRIFQRFSGFIYEHAGIKMPPNKKTMLEARLQKRLKALNIDSFEQYADFVFSGSGSDSELVHLIDVVTTNKTDFFREPAHFEYLVKNVLPTLCASQRDLQREPLRFWSAGCSSGEEPYTLAMVLCEYCERHPELKFSILASDISTKILKMAKTAVYPEERTDSIPLSMKKKYLLRSKDPDLSLVRIHPHLRSSVSFKRINFMDDDFHVNEKMDVIFCRNVVIYFDKQTQQALMRKFHRQLRPGGYLFIGHSESLNGLNVDFRPVASTMYRKEK